ncbi:hypothetical protein N0V83_002637 [Neocucurbitaria cava]|uniref:Uncharacterized protein n=1 Tax=Neocucurbitaria cava TaxID=798079 RepID=A0A9W8YE23_9PLEO|nr:hypothetical protein N0V83_002637 [Neocucurbitaria cava]
MPGPKMIFTHTPLMHKSAPHTRPHAPQLFMSDFVSAVHVGVGVDFVEDIIGGVVGDDWNSGGVVEVFEYGSGDGDERSGIEAFEDGDVYRGVVVLEKDSPGGEDASSDSLAGAVLVDDFVGILVSGFIGEVWEEVEVFVVGGGELSTQPTPAQKSGAPEPGSQVGVGTGGGVVELEIGGGTVESNVREREARVEASAEEVELDISEGLLNGAPPPVGREDETTENGLGGVEPGKDGAGENTLSAYGP